jgi:hypothetical protein
MYFDDGATDTPGNTTRTSPPARCPSDTRLEGDDFLRLAKWEATRGYSQRSATLGSTAAARRAGR